MSFLWGPSPKLDPRPKILLLLFGTVLFFLPLDVPILAISLGLLGLVGFFLIGRGLGRSILSILPILILTILLTPLFVRRGEPLWQVNALVVLTSGGLEETGRHLCRFIGITLCFSLFHRTTPAETLVPALGWFGLPYRAALILNLTLRFVPSFFILYRRIEEAHSLRRAEELPGRRGIVQRLKYLFPTLVSVLIQVVKRILPLSMTLELRGIGAAGNRTSYTQLPRGRRLAWEFVMTLLFMGMVIVALVLSSGAMV